MEREKPWIDGKIASSQPIDLDHLARYTLGAQTLEREVLELFCAQAASYFEQLRAAMSERDWKDAAHALKGSALAVGAFRVARAAEQAEILPGNVLAGEVFAQVLSQVLSQVLPQVRAARVDEIETSLREAEAYIAFLLKRR